MTRGEKVSILIIWITGMLGTALFFTSLTMYCAGNKNTLQVLIGFFGALLISSVILFGFIKIFFETISDGEHKNVHAHR